MSLAISFTISAMAFVQPASFDAYRRYLQGDWTLNKRMTYKVGGLSGKFSGVATFDPVDDLGMLLSYNESGMFAPIEDAFLPRETSNRLLYDFKDDTDAIDIYFAPEQGTGALTAEAMLSSAQYLYPLRNSGTPGTLVISHSDGPNSYAGRIEIEAPHAFIYSWRVNGPTLDGEIVSLFKRTSASVED